MTQVPTTEQRILEALRTGDKRSLELAQMLYLSRDRVRQCLKALVGKGFVTTEPIYEPALGRPPYSYSLVEEMYEQAYGDPYDELRGDVSGYERSRGPVSS